MLRSKKTLLLSLFVALFGVITIAVSTLAWFQISSQPIETGLVTGSSDIIIKNVDGIKKEQVTDPETGILSATD